MKKLIFFLVSLFTIIGLSLLAQNSEAWECNPELDYGPTCIDTSGQPRCKGDGYTEACGLECTRKINCGNNGEFRSKPCLCDANVPTCPVATIYNPSSNNCDGTGQDSNMFVEGEAPTDGGDELVKRPNGNTITVQQANDLVAGGGSGGSSGGSGAGADTDTCPDEVKPRFMIASHKNGELISEGVFHDIDVNTKIEASVIVGDSTDSFFDGYVTLIIDPFWTDKKLIDLRNGNTYTLNEQEKLTATYTLQAKVGGQVCASVEINIFFATNVPLTNEALTFNNNIQKFNTNNILSSFLPLFHLSSVFAQPAPETIDPTQLEAGKYLIKVDGYKDAEVTIYDSKAKVSYFEDLNGDGLKQENEPELNPEIIEIKVEKQASFSYLNFDTGWNAIALDVVSDNLKTASDLVYQLSEQDIVAVQVSRYINGEWNHYILRENENKEKIEYGNNFNLVPGQGYFVNTLNSGLFLAEGQKISDNVPINLEKGWNLVSVQSLNPYSSYDLLKKCNEDNLNCSTISKYENQLYNSTIYDQSSIYGEDFPLLSTKGYFLQTSVEKGTLNP